MDQNQLSVLEHTEIKGINSCTLVDLRDVKIQGNSASERLDSYLSQVQNPYCFKVGKTPVKISFATQGEPIETMLKAFFTSLRTS